MDTNTLTDEEKELVNHIIYLPLVLSVLEIDRKVTEVAGFKLKTPYLNLIEHTMKRVQKDLRKYNDMMRSKKIKIKKGKNDGVFTEYDYYIRGYHQTHRFFNANLRNQTEKYLDRYFND